MAMRTRLSRGERRARLLNAAERLFSRKGYRRTEIKEIVEAAGVTKPMLYRHFPGGKTEIFMAVLNGHIEGLLSALWGAMGSETDPRERLHSGIRAFVMFAEENPEGFRLLSQASPEIDGALGDRTREVRGVIAGGLINTISDVMKGAGLPTQGAPIYAYGLLGGAESVVSWWLESKSIDRETLVDYLLAYTWRGFDGLPRDPTRYHAGTVSIRPDL
jgi:AcrR family transcriptional regulator